MGQRHQLFVIAKIGNRYRGLAVFHHQWLYGAIALKRCLRILTIFSAPANRLPIQQELTAAGRLDEEFWTKPRSGKDFEVPFPFITTCLLLGASFDIKAVYNSHITLEPFNMAFNRGDNNDGITVIDITDLTHVRYCFLFWRDWRFEKGMKWTRIEGIEIGGIGEIEEDKDEDTGPRMTPLSGPMYLSVYHNAKERSNDLKLQTELQALEQQFDKWDLIDIASLANIWPQGDWQTAETEPMAGADISRTVRHVPSLRESTLARLVDECLQNPDPDLSWTAEAELLSGFFPAVKARIYSEPTLLASPVVKALLLKAIEHEQEVDLSPFQNLSMDDILSITSKLSKETKSLSLSGNVTAELLALVAEQNPSICNIYVLDAPNLQLQSTLQVMAQRGSPWIYHADMFRAPLESTRPKCFRSLVEDEQCTPEKAADLLPKASEKFPVVQIFWLTRGTEDDDDVTRLDDGGLGWATVSLNPDREYFLPCSHASIAAFPLRDGFLTISRVVTGLAKFMQCLTESCELHIGMSQEAGVAVAAAKCFALTASDLEELDTAKQVGVGPLPEKLFAVMRAMNHYDVRRPPPNVQPLRPGEWTIVVAHEPRIPRESSEDGPGEEKLRYAFITAASSQSEKTATGIEDMEVGRVPRNLIIADMESFLEQAVTIGGPPPQNLLNFWKQATDELRGEFGVCGGDEIASVLEVMLE